jgi:hypothetical protein
MTLETVLAAFRNAGYCFQPAANRQDVTIAAAMPAGRVKSRGIPVRLSNRAVAEQNYRRAG